MAIARGLVVSWKPLIVYKFILVISQHQAPSEIRKWLFQIARTFRGGNLLVKEINRYNYEGGCLRYCMRGVCKMYTVPFWLYSSPTVGNGWKSKKKTTPSSKKKVRSKILIFHEEILISKFRFGCFLPDFFCRNIFWSKRHLFEKNNDREKNRPICF